MKSDLFERVRHNLFVAKQEIARLQPHEDSDVNNSAVAAMGRLTAIEEFLDTVADDQQSAFHEAGLEISEAPKPEPRWFKVRGDYFALAAIMSVRKVNNKKTERDHIVAISDEGMPNAPGKFRAVWATAEEIRGLLTYLSEEAE